MAKCIITHPGQAHRDEFLAICLLLGSDEYSGYEVFRRDPMEEEFKYKTSIILDQGGKHDEELMNFDHHQLHRDAEPTCTITMVLEFLLKQKGSSLDSIRDYFPWIAASELQDSKGSPELASSLDIDLDVLEALRSPIESQLLTIFERCEYLNTNHTLHEIMGGIGRGILTYFEQFEDELKRLKEAVTVDEVNGLLIATVNGTFSVKAVKTLAVDGTITKSLRGGWSLFRYDHVSERVDFSKLEGMEGVTFAHKNGFLAVIDSEDPPNAAEWFGKAM